MEKDESTKVENATIHLPTEQYGFIEVKCEGMTTMQIAQLYLELKTNYNIAHRSN